MSWEEDTIGSIFCLSACKDLFRLGEEKSSLHHWQDRGFETQRENTETILVTKECMVFK